MLRRMYFWPLNLLGTFLLLMLLGQTEAQAVDFVTAIQIRQEYNDNIFFTSNNEVDDFITTVSPQIELRQKDERLNANVTARADGLFYVENGELNNIDQTLAGKFSFRVTPRFTLGADGSYKLDTRADRDVQTTGIVLGTKLRTQQRLGASAGYLLTEKASLNLGYAYRDDAFEKQPNLDFTTHSLTGAYSYRLDTYFPRTTARTSWGYTRADYVSAQLNNYTITLGLTRLMTELFTLSVDAGVRYTDTSFTGSNLESQQWGAVGQIELAYVGQLTRWSLVLSHDVTASSGLAGATKRTGLSGRYQYKLSEKFRANASASYYLNKSDSNEFSTGAVDEETYNLQMRLRYLYTEEIALESGYSLAYNKDKLADANRIRNLIYLQLYMEYTLFSK